MAFSILFSRYFLNSFMSNLFDQVLFEAQQKLKNKQPLEAGEFITKRKKGALDIQKKAEAKGGAALLTAVHFAAKQKPYEYSLKVCEKDNASELIKEKADVILEELEDWSNLTQQRFQHLMGMLEAYGEVYIQLK